MNKQRYYNDFGVVQNRDQYKSSYGNHYQGVVLDGDRLIRRCGHDHRTKARAWACIASSDRRRTA